MRKLLTLITVFVLSLVMTGDVMASDSLSIKIEQPKSPTNQTQLKITVVTLDRLNRALTVRCFKKTPSDGGFNQFGGDLSVSSGGNSVNCETPSSIFTNDGTYQFKASVQAEGGETVESDIVSVNYNTNGPGKPTSYNKDQIGDCKFKIRFRTADDGGKTVKVKIYRSDSTNFTLYSGTEVGSVSIGSNSDGEFTNDAPTCSKPYYYAIRAFDTAGNGSEPVGDTEVKIVSSGTTTAGQANQAGAIPVVNITLPDDGRGDILGEKTAQISPTGEILGETAKYEEKDINNGNPKAGVIIALGVIFAILGLGFYAKNKRKV